MPHRSSLCVRSSVCWTLKRLCLWLGAWLLAAALLTTSPECSAGETAGLLLPNTRWETPYFVNDSGREGPAILITGGVHGNEPSGARSADQIRHWPLRRGKLVVIPRVNRLGLEAAIRFMPEVPGEQRDLNRNFPGDSGPQEPRGELAEALWDFARRLRPNWVLDLHEGYEFHGSHEPPQGKAKSVGSTVIYFAGEERDALVERMLRAANGTVEREERRFVPLPRGPVNTSFARACVRQLGAEGMILETTYKDQPLSLRTRQHRLMVEAVLLHLRMVEPGAAERLTPAAEDRPVQVALYDGPGTGGAGVGVLTRLLDAAPQMEVRHVGANDMRPEVLRQFNVVLFPGGSGSAQARAIEPTGREAVREFVREGGGYLGICAGAYLCSSHYEWSLHLIDTNVFTGLREIEGVGAKQMWYRGTSTTVKLQLSEAGREVFSRVPEHSRVRYHNGPIVSPKGSPEMPEFTTLAWFRSEQVLHPPQQGTMIDTPAVITAPFGRGRVISISPHPESTGGLESMISSSISLLATREQQAASPAANESTPSPPRGGTPALRSGK